MTIKHMINDALKAEALFHIDELDVNTASILRAQPVEAGPVEHRCAGCGESFDQYPGESFNQASDRHDDEAYKLHVEMGMPTEPTLDGMDDVEADHE